MCFVAVGTVICPFIGTISNSKVVLLGKVLVLLSLTFPAVSRSMAMG